MRWTAERPKVPERFYWAKHTDRRREPEIVQLDSQGRLWSTDGYQGHVDDDDFNLYAGPIPLPEEAIIFERIDVGDMLPLKEAWRDVKLPPGPYIVIDDAEDEP